VWDFSKTPSVHPAGIKYPALFRAGEMKKKKVKPDSTKYVFLSLIG